VRSGDEVGFRRSELATAVETSAPAVIAAVNDDRILAENLAASPLMGAGTSFRAMRSYRCAGAAYNAGLDATDAEVVVFAHQDVYLPQPWLERLRNGIRAIEERDARWAVIGVYGMTETGQHVGQCWSTGLGKLLGAPFEQPRRAASVDEIVIVLRRASGLRFDEKLPGFHLYGADIVQSALAAGLSAYVIHAPVVHNSRPVETLAGAYSAAYDYMRKKWKHRLPIATTVVPLTRVGYPLIRARLRRAFKSRRSAPPREPGRVIAQRLGLEVFSTRPIPADEPCAPHGADWPPRDQSTSTYLANRRIG
jgi:hypothetical protein